LDGYLVMYVADDGKFGTPLAHPCPKQQQTYQPCGCLIEISELWSF